MNNRGVVSQPLGIQKKCVCVSLCATSLFYFAGGRRRPLSPHAAGLEQGCSQHRSVSEPDWLRSGQVIVCVSFCAKSLFYFQLAGDDR